MALADVVVQTAVAVQEAAREAVSAEFDLLYREHASGVESFIYQHVRDRALAEDLVQETFIRALRAWPTVDKDRPYGPWLRTIAMRLCIDTWRTPEANRVVSIDSEVGADSFPAGEADPGETLVNDARHNGISQALEELSARHRRILVLKESFGMRYEEIAKVEGTTLATVRCSLSVARKRFREKYLAVTAERGLGAIIFLPAFKGLRALRNIGMRVVMALQRADLASGASNLASAPAMQISSGIVAVAVVLGAFPLSGHSRPQHDYAHRFAGPNFTYGSDSLDTATPAVARRRLASLGGEHSPARDWMAADGGAAPLAPSPAAGGEATTDQGDGQSSGGPGSPYVGPDGAPQPPDHVGNQPVDSSPPIDPKPGDVTDPNGNVTQPEDSELFSFTSSSDGSVVFASGVNRGCATEMTCPPLLFRSNDGGHSWMFLKGTNLDGGTVILPPAYGAGDNRIFATSRTGVLLVSTDAGDSFAPITAGASQFAGSAAISPAFDAGDPRIVVGSKPIAEYDDSTKTMAPAAYPAISSRIEPIFASPELLLAGGLMLDDQGVARAAVYRCWGHSCTGVIISKGTAIPRLSLSPGFQTNQTVYAFTEEKVFRSTDGGASFAKVTDWTQARLKSLALMDGKLFASTHSPDGSPAGLYVSTDDGTSWIQVADPSFSSGTTAIHVVGSRVFVGLAVGGVACSADGGTTWASRC